MFFRRMVYPRLSRGRFDTSEKVGNHCSDRRFLEGGTMSVAIKEVNKASQIEFFSQAKFMKKVSLNNFCSFPYRRLEYSYFLNKPWFMQSGLLFVLLVLDQTCYANAL